LLGGLEEGSEGENPKKKPVALHRGGVLLKFAPENGERGNKGEKKSRKANETGRWAQESKHEKKGETVNHKEITTPAKNGGDLRNQMRTYKGDGGGQQNLLFNGAAKREGRLGGVWKKGPKSGHPKS